MLKAFLNDENGFIVSAELVLVLTIGVLSMIVGLHEVATAVNIELNDLSNAIGALNQSYNFCGFAGTSTSGKVKSTVAGSSYGDVIDSCDCNSSCAIVCSAATPEAGGGVTEH